MLRSKKIALVAHCILNANAKVKGLATYAGIMPFVINQLSVKGYGLIQLPCPELTLLGLRRWGQTLEQYQTPFYRNHCIRLSKEIIPQLIEYQENGYRADLLIGIDGSPSCGVHQTCSGDWGGCFSCPNLQIDPCIKIDGRGVFIECLLEIAEDNGIHLARLGIDEDGPSSSEADLIRFLDNIQ